MIKINENEMLELLNLAFNLNGIPQTGNVSYTDLKGSIPDVVSNQYVAKNWFETVIKTVAKK
jgi:hypothetical protein